MPHNDLIHFAFGLDGVLADGRRSTTGTKLYRFSDSWHQIHADNFSDADESRIHKVFAQA